MKKRLNRFLAEAGIGARRKVEDLVRDGRVSVNGAVCEDLGAWVDGDEVRVDGKVVEIEEKVCFMVNKPIGYTCSHERVGKKKILYDLLPNFPFRLFSAGRLDRETSGLIIVTNDGSFSQRVIHPSAGIEKEYIVKTNREIMHHDLVKMSEGARVTGVWVKPVSVTKVRRGTIKIVVKEGRKHEVREIVAAAGIKVLELKRIRIGGLRLGSLPEGGVKELNDKEKESLFS
ncbi:MAG: pseudouridine synthase [Simkaniaceae bacterium]|nr:pseudouridine synthase [Simkaniaceae bacterium]